MKFDAIRMAKLAGLGTNSTNLIAEASNRSMREEDALSGEDEARFGKGQINEEDLDDELDDLDLPEDDDYELDLSEEEKEEDVDEIAWGPIGAAIGSAAIGVGAGYAGEKLAQKQNEDVVYEISETMLRDEINRMRKARSQNINEAKLRSVVRNEIANALKEMLENDDESLNNDGSWIYGNNKPKRSKKGHVAVGAFGIGFE